jgi:hypothetical protein
MFRRRSGKSYPGRERAGRVKGATEVRGGAVSGANEPLTRPSGSAKLNAGATRRTTLPAYGSSGEDAGLGRKRFTTASTMRLRASGLRKPTSTAISSVLAVKSFPV